MSQNPEQLNPQIPLDLYHFPSHSGDDFIISGCNKAAVKLVERWPDWSAHGLILLGPKASGKSHLAAIWADKAGAKTVSAGVLSENLEALMADKAPLVVEDIDRLSDEQALFHLYNSCREEGRDLLLTSKIRANELKLSLADLRSRLLSLPVGEIATPEEFLLETIMAKQFTDRQIAVDPTVLSFLVKRMERSFSMAEKLVEGLDKLSLSHKRRITKPLAKTLLESL